MKLLGISCAKLVVTLLKKAIKLKKFEKKVFFKNFQHSPAEKQILWKGMPEGSLNPKFHQDISIPSAIMGNYEFWARIAQNSGLRSPVVSSRASRIGDPGSFPGGSTR